MLSIDDKDWTFQIVAHRGFKAHYAENTMISFEKAVEAKATMLELDVRMTKDEVIVILHDPTLLRLGKHRWHVSSLLWHSLQEIKIRQSF
jgi:glycerophosphoryl diester phosphodiesterase